MAQHKSHLAQTQVLPAATMARKPVPQPPSIQPSTSDEPVNEVPKPKSVSILKSPTSPRTPFRFSSKPQDQVEQPTLQVATEDLPEGKDIKISPTTGLPERQHNQDWNPATSPVKGGFFSNYKASKSSSRLQSVDTIRHVKEDDMSKTDSSVSSRPVLGTEKKGKSSSSDKSTTRRPVAKSSKSENSITNSLEGELSSSNTSNVATANNSTLKKTKPKTFNILGRARSIRNDKDEHSFNDYTSTFLAEPEATHIPASLKTAPLRQDNERSLKDIMNMSARNHSVDRLPATREIPTGREQREGIRNQPSFASFAGAGGHAFLSNLKNGGSKAVNMSKGLFNKVGRSGSSNEKEVPVEDEFYRMKVINLSLIEQTRRTRISKKLEESRDKTEFWMPAFPWRAIDYLNFRGTETEGLYRVPGSGPQIKRWQRRFDEELDVDLFQQEDLYDINIIGSMLKAWLRELPEEVFPKSSQDKISRECAGSEKVPQLLIDELSNLPPYNYYLLFAITCHLSLLLDNSSKNKMDFRNLCICFQPCMKIDALCFKFLVVDWRECWKGCKTEDFWIAKEYALMELPPPGSSGEGRSSIAVESHDERNISSADSSKPSSVSIEGPVITISSTTPATSTAIKRQSMSFSQSTPSILAPSSNSSTTPTATGRGLQSRGAGEVEQLSPIAPLSPMDLNIRS